MSGLSKLMVVVPVSVFLTVSFFVLFALRKVEEKWFKVFGYVVVGFLWLSALVLFSGGVCNISKDHSKMKYMMQQNMRAPYRSQMMQKGGMVMPEKKMLPKGKNLSEVSGKDGNRGFILKGE